jgi:hypothetical protein
VRDKHGEEGNTNHCISEPVGLYLLRAVQIRPRHRRAAARAVLRPTAYGGHGEAMPILESRADRQGIRRILLTTGLGAVLGFQSCRFLAYGFGVSIPWYGLAWILLIHTLMGLSAGATTGLTRWWKQGLVLGLVFGVTSALGALALGLKWLPYGVAAITEGLVDGLLIASIADAVVPLRRTSNDPNSPGSGPLLNAGSATSPKRSSMSATWRRLAEEKTCLDHLDAERAYQRNTSFGKTTEDRILWSELLDLELQDIDEQVSRICQAGDASDHRSRTSDGR